MFAIIAFQVRKNIKMKREMRRRWFGRNGVNNKREALATQSELSFINDLVLLSTAKASPLFCIQHRYSREKWQKSIPLFRFQYLKIRTDIQCFHLSIFHSIYY